MAALWPAVQNYTLLLTDSRCTGQGPRRTKGDSMSGTVRVQVLMRPDEASRFEKFCEARGHKKSTLIARLIREHLDREGGVSVALRKAQ